MTGLDGRLDAVVSFLEGDGIINPQFSGFLLAHSKVIYFLRAASRLAALLRSLLDDLL